MKNACDNPAIIPKVMPARRSFSGFEVMLTLMRQHEAMNGKNASH